MPVAYRQLRSLLKRERFDIIHAHTPVGGVLTRLAARNARKSGTKIVYTAHGFHFYDGGPLLNWILWYPVERFMTRMTDALVTINQEDYRRAKQFAHCKVIFIPGVGLEEDGGNSPITQSQMREALGLKGDDFVILAVGDLNSNKNHSVLIKAISKLDRNTKLLIAGNGPLKQHLEKEADTYRVSSRVQLLGFRTDINDLLRACDIFCLPSKRECLPVSLIEAIAAGIPCLTSNARGCSDVLGPLSSVCIVKKNTETEWAKSIQLFKDQQYRSRIGVALRKQSKQFTLENVLPNYVSLYLSLFSEGADNK